MIFSPILKHFSIMGYRFCNIGSILLNLSDDADELKKAGSVMKCLSIVRLAVK